jgi:flagellin
VVYAGSAGAPSLSGLLAVQDSLNRAASISDVGLSAGQTITDLLSLVRAKAAAAQAATSPADKAALDADYQQLLQTIGKMAGSASFGGVTMLNGAASGDLSFKADPNSDLSVSLTPLDLTTAGLGLAGTSLTGSDADLASLLGQVDAASASASTQLARLGVQSQQIQTHLSVLGQLQSSLADATAPDLGAEGARLQALQVQQMLAGQDSGVVNQAPQALLSLFRAG